MALEFLHPSDPAFWIGLFAVVVLFLILNWFGPKEKLFKFLLGLRAAIFILFLILLFNPVLTVHSENKQPLKWAVFVDNSASIKNHKTPSLSAIQNGIKSFIDQLSQKEIKVDYYQFDSALDKNNGQLIEGNGISTNLGLIPVAIENSRQTLAGAIIISDGLITEGRDPLPHIKNLSLPIHTIGIGAATELVDVSVLSIDVPTVVLKGDGIQVRAIIQSVGQIQDRLSVSLFNGKKLLASKHIQLVGLGSKKEVQFRFTPDEIGQQKYEVRISSVKDEINIVNNRQSFNLLVLKDQYKVAMITGSPNKNTSILKRLLKKNSRFQVDHFIRITESRFKPEIKSFWATPYELIILDNFPIQPLSVDFIRILGKKILTHQSALMLVSGPNQTNISLKGFNSILGVTIHDSIEVEGQSFWNFVINGQFNETDLPPLIHGLVLSGVGDSADSLATFESGWPLWIQNQNGNIRTAVFTAKDLNVLHYHNNADEVGNTFSYMITTTTNWLLKTGGVNENFFRLNKDRYKQGELVEITGYQPFDTKIAQNNVSIQIKEGKQILFSRDIGFNIETNRWEGVFRAPKPGNYTFEIQMSSNEMQIQSGQFYVMESQIELSQVYLNRPLLVSIAESGNGQYVDWKDRLNLINVITQKVRHEFKADVIKFIENKLLLILMIILLTVEWAIRRQKGLS